MTQRKIRVAPLEPSEWTDEVREALGPRANSGHTLNIFTTLAHHPLLMKRWLVFASYLFGGSTLPPRDRELVILRTGYRCKSEYEFGQHANLARQVGISDEEIRRVTLGPGAPGWSAFDVLLLRATDELHEEKVIGDATWDALRERYDTKQLFDLVFTIGQYTLVSMVLNTLGVQRDEGVEGFPG